MSTRDIEAGKAHILLGVRSKLDSGLKAAEDRLKKFGSSVAKLGVVVSGMGSAVAGPLMGMVRHFQTAGNAADDMATRVNVTTDALTELGFAAEMNGANIEVMSNGLFRMQRRLANAASGGGPAKRAIEALGIEIQSLSQLEPDKQFEVIADALNDIPDSAFRAQLGFELMGDAFRPLDVLLKEGSSGIRDLREEAQRLGASISPDDAAAATSLAAAFVRLGTAVKGTFFQIGAAIGPQIEMVINWTVDATQAFRDFIKENRGIALIVFNVAAAFVAAGTAIVGIGIGIVTLGATVGILAKALALLISPVGLVVVGLGAATYAILRFTDLGGKAIAWLTDRFGPLIQTIKDFGTVLFDRLAGGDLLGAVSVLADGMEAIWLDLTNGIRGMWDSAMDFINRAQAGVAIGIAKTITGFANLMDKVMAGMRKMFRETLDLVSDGTRKAGQFFGFIADKLSEKTGMLPGLGAAVRGAFTASSIGVSVIGAGGDAAFGGLQAATEQFTETARDFGRHMEDVARIDLNQKRHNREAAAEERRRRLDHLREQFAAEAKQIRQRDEAISKHESMLGDFLAQREEATEQGRMFTSGAFSSAAAMRLGGAAMLPQERTARGVEKLVEIQQAMLKKQGQQQMARFMD